MMLDDDLLILRDDEVDVFVRLLSAFTHIELPLPAVLGTHRPVPLERDS
jgi:hypothetical protein